MRIWRVFRFGISECGFGILKGYILFIEDEHEYDDEYDDEGGSSDL